MRVRLWPDGLGARIAIILLAALMLEFVGSELLFQRAEADRASHAHAGQLVEHLAVAERLASSLPPEGRDAGLRRLWTGPLRIGWAAETLVPDAAARTPRLREFQAIVRAAAPAWSGRAVRLSGHGDIDRLTGALQLQDGSWLEFEAVGYLHPPRTLTRHAGPLLLLAACVALVALIFTWMIARPLRKLAGAADRVGQDEGVTVVPAEGPREVRQVAVAFNAMQARLLEQVEARMQALAALSHDLRTPIARLRLRAPDIGRVRVRAGVEHDLDEMERFITSVLDYLRGGDAEAEARVDLASIVQTIVDDAHDVGGNIAYEGPRRLEIVTRPVKLQRAILNLVQNALQQGGDVRVLLSRAGAEAVIAVEDDGPGIPPDELEAVFQPFYRLEGSRSRGTGGAGLGLSIVHRSVGRLGGVVTLENRAEGGLRATIRLPSRTPT